jgi:hypothetical protein
MFGEMIVVPILNLRAVSARAGGSLDCAVARLLDLTEHPEIKKWIEFPKALFVFLIVPSDRDRGRDELLARTAALLILAASW